MSQGKFLPSNEYHHQSFGQKKVLILFSFLSGSWKIASFLPFKEKIFSGSEVSNSGPEPCFWLWNFYEILVIQNIVIDCE